ncbi:F-box domain-containing protein [Cadophora sp. DSE1049]|nr:F-box domain-containing protein [Cadophora sp. DSE1049]
MDLDADVLIERVSWRPRYILNSMVTIRDAIQPAFVSRAPGSSNIGLLNTLPPELLRIVFELLDFRSLSRFARVCHQGKATVESLPAYRDLIKHAFTTLAAFGRTELITFHSAASIYTALLSEKCVACEQFAPFLYLPTSERCCYECLHRNRSLRVISSGMVRKCFGLMPKDLRRIPSMLSIPGTYSVGHTITYRRRTRLFSLKQAKALGVAEHGSAEAMEHFVTLQNAGKLTTNETHDARWLTGHPSTIGSDANVPADRFCGMASTEFPALQPNDVLEKGVWCLGCRANFLNYHGTRILDAETRLLVSGADPLLPLLDLQHRARSKSAFVEHIRVCKGAKDLLRGLEASVQASKDFL